MPKSFNAPLAEYPDYNSRERGKIGSIIAIRDHLVEINPDSPRVWKRIEALTWALEALKDHDAEVDYEKFYCLRDRRNYLETIPEEEQDGFVVREFKAIDWVMEELVEGSGHRIDRRKVVPWFVKSLDTPIRGGFESGVVLAETEEEAIDIVLKTQSVRYGDDDLRHVYTDGAALSAVMVKYVKGIVHHSIG